MKLLFTALAFVSAGALACPADKEVQAAAPDKAAVAKAPERATVKPVASKKAQTPTKVADQSAASTRKSSL
jgi:hypothetical protein